MFDWVHARPFLLFYPLLVLTQNLIESAPQAQDMSGMINKVLLLHFFYPNVPVMAAVQQFARSEQKGSHGKLLGVVGLLTTVPECTVLLKI